MIMRLSLLLNLELTAITNIELEHLTGLLWRLRHLSKIGIKLVNINIDIADSEAAFSIASQVLDHDFGSINYLISNLV
jgi:hypothetical protein